MSSRAPIMVGLSSSIGSAAQCRTQAGMPRSRASFNVAKSFKSFFNYSGFFRCVLGALSPTGELGDPNLNGVSCDKSRLEQLFQHATIHVFRHGLSHEM